MLECSGYHELLLLNLITEIRSIRKRSLLGKKCVTSNHKLLGKRHRIVTEYDGIYSPRNGLVAAYHTHKHGAEPLFWADVAFALWIGIVAMVSGNPKNLRYIAQAWICNDFTVSIMDTAIAGDPRKRVVVFKPGDEAFLALLGTPNGVGGVYLLMHHKEALGLKTISRVVIVFDDGGVSPSLIFQVVDMPAPRRILEHSLSADDSSGVSSVARSNVSSSSSHNIWGGSSGLCNYRGSSRTAGTAVDS